MLWLYQQPAWVLGLILLLILLLFMEVGYRVGLRHGHVPKETEKTLRGDVTLSAMLALLGLMLAFTYAFSLSRADLRKQAVVWPKPEAIDGTWKLPPLERVRQ